MTRCLTRCLRRGVAAADEVRAVVPRLRSTHLVKKKEAPPQLSHAQAVLGVVNLALRGFSVVNTHKPEPKSTRRMDTHACSEHVVIEGYVQAGKCFKEGITESRVFQRTYLDKFLAFLRNTRYPYALQSTGTTFRGIHKACWTLFTFTCTVRI
jgi:hypothetical protein